MAKADGTMSLDPLENTGITATNIPYSTLSRHYVGNKIYEDKNLKRILLPNGYISNGNYYFYLRDHLENNCVIVKDDGTEVQRTYYYPYGKVNEYESIGQSAQPFKFGGKELEPMHGLNLFDFVTRQLNTHGAPDFTTMDMLSELRPWESPYAYCGNNPVSRIDPTGTFYEGYMESDGHSKDKYKPKMSIRTVVRTKYYIYICISNGHH
jgi:RHS repeat-associated protein